MYKDRPLNAVELGRSTWPLLHRLSMSYPELPQQEHKEGALRLIKAFSKVYPCKFCAHDFQEKIVEVPPRLESREEFALWVCE